MIRPMDARRYNEFCALATALDVVGERWTLLVVRELLLGPKRYSDLREGLPGIASNLLATRLRTLEQNGLVGGVDFPDPPHRPSTSSPTSAVSWNRRCSTSCDGAAAG